MHGPKGLRAGADEGGRAGRCGQLCPSAISRPRHPLHTPAPISGCEPRPPCDRPSSGEGWGGPSTTEPGRQRPPPLPSSLAGWTGAGSPSRPGLETLPWAARPSLLRVRGADLPPSFLAKRPGGRLPLPSCSYSDLVPSPRLLQSACPPAYSHPHPPPPSSDFGATVPKGPPSFLHGLRQ